MQAAAPPPLAFEPVPTLSLIDSLYQSRQTLLFDTFAIFKSPSRPRTGTISEQPHSLEHIATANLAIGPHSFPDTRLYLCEWAQPAATAPPPPPAPTLNPAAITPALIARLNAASQTDPALAAILQKAASGQASPEELSGLARYIDDMRQEEAGAPPPPAPAPVPAPPADSSAAPLPTHPSLVLEFRELSGGEQFILPAHYIYSPLHSHVPQPLGAQDVLLSFFVFPSERASTPSMFKRGRPRSAPQGQGLDGAAAGLDQDAPVPVDMIVQGCGEYARECMFRAARNGRKKDEQVEMWWRQMISSVPSRTHVLFVPPPRPSARDATPPDGALDSTAAAHGHPASSALSRTASQLAVGGAATPGSASGGAAGQKRGGTPKEGPGGGKKAKLGGGGKKGPRASNARSVSNLAGSPTASPGPSSLAGSPGPLGLDDDPALVSVVSSGAGGRRPTRRAAASRKGRKTYNEDSGDDDFGVKEERG
ncbi:uncharacterized protein RHOBADRAFT_51311 [Rhodotorula graminis WP1]|uniref:Uncharacterized protein n=1 Tax=Rhodotorula graminis (strain WP1) TaxID=578459 RepID=A0A194SDI5_RHOGW|nr:uncharacterized protein RHOBADRAFT_51311 [Rhodotorula graminis WP1]KPV77461.1 hypothetical protein RHOBADRAFT_51311 [Rhodotorula graminis WP1]